jgi:hypothetical protein
MQRTKQWWATLTLGERSELHWLELHNSKYSTRGSADLPDDCSECRVCNTPHPGIGLCPTCSQRLDELVNKATNAIRRMVKKIEKSN